MIFTPIWWLLASVPVLVALYFLKLKRREVVVSSTILWRRSVEDLHVNAPFQRLRKNILLLLQLLVILALIIALWRPRIVGDLVVGRNVIILVDVSASMSAIEGEKETRLDRAKARATEMIRALGNGDRMAILEFAARTRTVEPLSGDRSALLAAVDSIEPTASPTDLAQALVVGGSLAESLESGEVVVLGDGCYAGVEGLPEEVKRQSIRLVSVATPLENVAITEIDVRHDFEVEQRTEVLAVIENTGRTAWQGKVALRAEEGLRDLREVEVGADSSRSLVFEVSGFEGGVLGVDLESSDALDLDDRAAVHVEPPQKIRVLFVGERQPWVELVLAASAAIDHRRMELAAYEAAVAGLAGPDAAAKLGVDVVLFDREAPSGPPLIPAIYIGCRPELPGEPTLREVEFPAVIDWDRTHPVNRFLVYTDLAIETATVLSEGSGLPETAGVHSLVDSDEGSLISTYHHRVAGSRPVSCVLIGFDILSSNWPLGHYSFPIFFANALAWLRSESGGSDVSRYRTGEALEWRSADARSIDLADARIRAPSGEMLVPGADESGGLVLPSPSETGVYEVVVGGETVARLPVALLDRAESRLLPAKAIDFGAYEVQVTEGTEKGILHYWKWFALAALAFLLVEWVVYNRRVGY